MKISVFIPALVVTATAIGSAKPFCALGSLAFPILCSMTVFHPSMAAAHALPDYFNSLEDLIVEKRHENHDAQAPQDRSNNGDSDAAIDNSEEDGEESDRPQAGGRENRGGRRLGQNGDGIRNSTRSDRNRENQNGPPAQAGRNRTNTDVPNSAPKTPAPAPDPQLASNSTLPGAGQNSRPGSLPAGFPPAAPGIGFVAGDTTGGSDAVKNSAMPINPSKSNATSSGAVANQPGTLPPGFPPANDSANARQAGSLNRTALRRSIRRD